MRRAGVIYQHVETAQLVSTTINHIADEIVVSNRGFAKNGENAEFLDFGQRFLRFRLRSRVIHGNGIAVFREA